MIAVRNGKSCFLRCLVLPVLTTALLLCGGCAKSARTEFFAMDTVITMELSGGKAQKGLELAREELLRLDALLSIEGADSEIAALNRGERSELSSETLHLVETAMELSQATGGAYDCTVQPVVEAWGWYSGEPAVPDEATLKQALSLVGSDKLTLNERGIDFALEGMGLDLGGIGKGYAAGCLDRLLREAGVTSGWISLGGNIRAIGSKQGGAPWVIGIADPDDPSAYLCAVSVRDCAVVTSGDYQRCFEQDGVRLHHILDPQTGWPAQLGLRSVTVVCGDDTLADGLSTALFVMGPERAENFWRSGPYEFEAVFITGDGIRVTEGLADSFSCDRNYEVVYR